MPCNYSGFINAKEVAKYGIVDFDWSNAKGEWVLQKPMDCAERLVKQAAMVKAFNNETRVFVCKLILSERAHGFSLLPRMICFALDRNLVKALPWYSDVRTKLTNPQFSGFFLKFKPNASYHVPQCTDSVVGARKKCSAHYHDQVSTQWLLRERIITSHIRFCCSRSGTVAAAPSSQASPCARRWLGHP